MVGTDVDRPEIDPSTDPLWLRLEAFEFDELDADLTFSDRLARDNGWTMDYARRVIDEYKRFCYLAMRAGHEVTPSDQVDQVWHLHLSYSRNYWEEFCPNILQSNLHHGPTKGGQTEAEKYYDWYTQTLESYVRISGDNPPEDIWPPPFSRFSHADAMRRVDTDDYLVLKRPPRGALRAVQIASVLAALAGFWFGAAGIGFLFAALAIAIRIYRGKTDNRRLSKRSRREGESGGGFFGGCGGGLGGGDGGAGCGGGGGD
jgi:hypothetical protein